MVKNISRKKKKTNILSIADNPRFKPPKTVFLPSTVSPQGRFTSYTIGENVFGFLDGDELVCRMDFDPDELSEKALVVADTPDGQKIKPACIAENIIAVVVGFVREVAQ